MNEQKHDIPGAIKRLPKPPPGKNGWPWFHHPYEATDDGSPATWPRITVVTPSYNQGQFLEETIRSVILQNYPNLQHLIIDGGSTDDSVEVIKRYEGYVDYWVSEPDNGQSQAINKGFAMADGEIYCWLNSDDLFLPGALRRIGRCFANSDCGIVSGHTLEVGSDTQTLFMAEPCSIDHLVDKMRICTPQQSTFWRREVWDMCGPLAEDLHYAMDFDLWLRMAASNFEWRLVDEPMAIFRRYEEQKTATSYQSRIEAHDIIARFRDSPFYREDLHRDAVHRALYVEGWLEYAHARHYTSEHKLPYWVHWALLPVRNWRCLQARHFYPRFIRRLGGE